MTLKTEINEYGTTAGVRKLHHITLTVTADDRMGLFIDSLVKPWCTLHRSIECMDCATIIIRDIGRCLHIITKNYAPAVENKYANIRAPRYTYVR